MVHGRLLSRGSSESVWELDVGFVEPLVADRVVVLVVVHVGSRDRLGFSWGFHPEVNKEPSNAEGLPPGVSAMKICATT
eukprot:9502504-Pyramimonas_sp.AAC.1